MVMTSALVDDPNHNQIGNESKGCSTLMPKVKERRSLDEFNQFCSFILAYEASKETTTEDRKPVVSPHSPSDSSTSSVTDSISDDHRRHSLKRPRTQKKSTKADKEYDSDDEAWEEVTCYCEKPFAGRPMIECSHCLTWIHLSCAKVRKSNIPKKFTCQRCRDLHLTSSIFFSNSQVKQKSNGNIKKRVSC